MLSTLFLSVALSASIEPTHVEVHQLSGVSFECVCHSDEASPDFDCSESCQVATQNYIKTHEVKPAESCKVNPKNCVEFEEVK